MFKFQDSSNQGANRTYIIVISLLYCCGHTPQANTTIFYQLQDQSHTTSCESREYLKKLDNRTNVQQITEASESIGHLPNGIIL